MVEGAAIGYSRGLITAMNAHPKGQALEGVSVLVVEDDPDVLEVFDVFLTYAGATVRATANAEEAVEACKAAPPAVLLTDLVLRTGPDGLWLLEQVRALPGRRIPVIAVTGRMMPKDRETIRAAGFDAHLFKPVDLDEVADLIRTLIGR